MKNKNYLLITAILVAFSIIACNEDDYLPSSREGAPVQTGAYLRSITLPASNTINLLNIPDASYSLVVEGVTPNNGGDLASINVYVSLTDNSPDDMGETQNLAEALLSNIPSSEFVIDSNSGFPRATISFTGTDFLTALNATEDNIDGGDQFIVRLEAVLEDGRTFSASNTGADTAGGFYSSPFTYGFLVVCDVEPALFTGDWTVQMSDSYGDGWQTTTNTGGPGLMAILDGGSTVIEVGLCTPYETPSYDCVAELSSGTATVNIPEGTETLVWSMPGDFFSEISFTIIAPSGNVVATYAIGDPAGEVALNLCNETL